MARRNLNLRMDDDARAAWRAFTKKEGVTLTSLLDALGFEVKDNPKVIPRRVIERAREIGDERLAR